MTWLSYVLAFIVAFALCMQKAVFANSSISVNDLYLGYIEASCANLSNYLKGDEEPVIHPASFRQAIVTAPVLEKQPPTECFGVGLKDKGDDWEVNAGDFRILVNKNSAMLMRWETDAGQCLAEPGGICFEQWPAQELVGPAGRVTALRREGNELLFHWQKNGLSSNYRVVPHRGYILWEVTVPNMNDTLLSIEVRLSLPVQLGEEKWLYWNGLNLNKVNAKTRGVELTTLSPGSYLSQGIFPAVSLNDHKFGIGVGLFPMDIESFYGSRVNPACGLFETFCYVVRTTILPGKERKISFVLFATDPNWSWRSLVERYWTFWPEVFAPPKRDDIWGLYIVSSPKLIHKLGDRFIDICRRLRVGGLELYAPFSKTGDFYPDHDLVYNRDNVKLDRNEMLEIEEIANIASCNLSYVIPIKCERQLAKKNYSDSMIRELSGNYFIRNDWDVMGDKMEKLAAMFAWGDSFGKNLMRELSQIVKIYNPEGFYFDNGALVWSDYGRYTQWSAFDNSGMVYTNAGIAYAKLQDYLKKNYSFIHQCIGETSQYFSGFRAQSHLANLIDTQPFYLRSHRLIMGYKPIFMDHPKYITKQRLFNVLELGGLPWMVRLMPGQESLAHEWAPVAISLARAGWRPISAAKTNNSDIQVERFGQGDGTYFTVRNTCKNAISVTLTLKGNYPLLDDFRRRGKLCSLVNEREGMTIVSLTIPGEELIVLRATPQTAARIWPNAKFLAEAKSASIVACATDKIACRIAHCIKGFIEMQADLIGRKAEVEIINDQSEAKYPNHILILIEKKSKIEVLSETTLIIAGPDEVTIRNDLNDFLETIEVPWGNKEPPKWSLAAPEGM